MSSSEAQAALERWLASVESMGRAAHRAGLFTENGPLAPATNGADQQERDAASNPSPGIGDGSAGVSDKVRAAARERIRQEGEQVGWIEGTTARTGLRPSPTAINGQKAYDLQWLRRRCEDIASLPGGLDASSLQEQILLILNLEASENQLQSSLADIVGYSDFDFITDLLEHRLELITSRKETPTRTNGFNGTNGTNGVQAHLRTKQQREDDLKQQDFAHKTAIIREKMDREEPRYPHVYKQYQAGNTLGLGGKKYALPVGSKREEFDNYEEYTIPAAKIGVLGADRPLLQIADLDQLCRGTFRGYKTLNRMQSLVYPVAYQTNENMLICAPTGAGKTDAAVLTMLNTIARYSNPNPQIETECQEFAVRTQDFKIIYVAPMKALAAEITAKLGQRLAWLGIAVRELTGDMHMTKAEIVKTQIIVTTPEKWDVVTRNSIGDTELVQKVRLLIIDEVHMLHDERGAVLESIVARTERQVESTQSLIRIVGLSATLPNYIDVSDFLKVNRYAGLFYFDQSFRPVPLEQHFIGVKGNAGSKISRENLDLAAFEQTKKNLEKGHQVMVFVHKRRDTAETAKNMYEHAIREGATSLFDPTQHPHYDQAVRDLQQSKAREIRELFKTGFGVHHAGMARSDRNLMERLFEKGVIKVLCCTATLAWGVNLPAAAVVIKGTQLYNSQEGKYVDLGILDVLQIFGRAGRPQYQDVGIGIILTTHDKLAHYLSVVTQQTPIESRLVRKVIDNLNAEIALGTVTTVQEGVQWLGYTFLFIRWKRNPFAYGIDWSEARDDPMLVQRRRKLIIMAARVLAKSQMIIFTESTEELRTKDVGRIASRFYILRESIDLFNVALRPDISFEEIFAMISTSAEFENLQSKEAERGELGFLRENPGIAPVNIKGRLEESHTKVNILLQSYISNARVEDFALGSDMAYIAQNAPRVCRCLFEIALSRHWGKAAMLLLQLCKSFDKRVWYDSHPLAQFDFPFSIVRQLRGNSSVSSIERLREMDPSQLGDLVNNRGMGKKLSHAVNDFPILGLDAEIAPLNRNVLKVKVWLTPDFVWNERVHGKSESYWVWVEHSETSEILHHDYFILSKKKLYDDHELNFTIPLDDPLPNQIYVRALSSRWLGAETVTAISFQHLIRPDTESVFTDLLDLQPLPITALNNPLLEGIYGQRFSYFNPMQTQIFHCLYNTSSNVLLGSPTGSGKTVAAELAMWRTFREQPGSKVVYIAPMKALVRERVKDWGSRFERQMGIKLVELTGDNTPDTSSIRQADIIITTPEKWDGISRSWQTRNYVKQVGLVIIDEIHLLGGDRGPILEIIVSRMNYIASQVENPIRIVGMSTACANATDLGGWLGAKEGLFNFRHSVRPVPLEIYIDGFAPQAGFCPLMQSMNRPTFLAIKNHSPTKPVIVFVASRRQTKQTATDLINFCGMEENPRRFVRMSDEDLQLHLSRARNQSLQEALSFGIGLHHAGLVESDRSLVEELFANNKIQVLVATSTLAWGVNLPAHLVVVKGTQFFDAKIQGYKDMDLTDVLQMLGRAGRPQFDTSGIARIFTQDSTKDFYKQFINKGFPVESSLHNVLDDHLGAEIAAETILSKQEALDYLTWTFFFRRVHKNPSYYGLEMAVEDYSTVEAETLANDYMMKMIDDSLTQLKDSGCAKYEVNGDVFPTALGKIASYYYLSHKTIRLLKLNARPAATMEDCLRWMSLATEYDELPVRHNEDLVNAELAKHVTYDADRLGKSMLDPHVKAFLLLQVHLSRDDLPISDYITDTNSVLDQSIRILQASIDVMIELGYLSSAISFIVLLQAIKSARWPEDGPMSIFPGVSMAKERARIHGPSAHPKDMSMVASLTEHERRQLCASLEVPPLQQHQILRTMAKLPDLALKIGDTNAVSFVLVITRRNPVQDKNYKAYTPLFPKSQSEGWFVVVCDEGSDKVIAFKRASWAEPTQRRGHVDLKSSIRCKIMLPRGDVQRVRRYDVKVISDTYIKMEYGLQGVEVPAAPRVVDSGEKEKTQQLVVDGAEKPQH